MLTNQTKEQIKTFESESVNSYGENTLAIARHAGILKHGFGFACSGGFETLTEAERKKYLDCIVESLEELLLAACRGMGVLPHDVVAVCGEVERIAEHSMPE